MLRKLIVLLTLVWMVVGVFYFFTQLDWKSGAIAATGVIGFFTALANSINKKDSIASVSQKAKAKNNSSVIQVGRDYSGNDK